MHTATIRKIFQLHGTKPIFQGSFEDAATPTIEKIHQFDRISFQRRHRQGHRRHSILPHLLSSFLSHFFASVLKVIHLPTDSKSMARPGRLGLNVSSNMWGVRGQPCFIINSRPMCSQGGKAGCQGNELI